jgi:hypothetical protein
MSGLTAQRASIAAAIGAIWLNGIPLGVPLKDIDDEIIRWQKANGRAITSSKSIRRYLSKLGQKTG